MALKGPSLHGNVDRNGVQWLGHSHSSETSEPPRPLLQNGLSHFPVRNLQVSSLCISVCPPVTRKASVTAPRHSPAPRLLLGSTPDWLHLQEHGWTECFCNLCGKHHCQWKRSVETSLKLTGQQLGRSEYTNIGTVWQKPRSRRLTLTPGFCRLGE